MNFFFRALILILFGILLLRVVGRKSISQMTIAETVIMISIGTLIVQPIANRSIWRAIYGAGIFVAVTMIVEYLQLKIDPLEKLITGRAKVVITNGQLVPETLKKMRITVDQLEMRLRQAGIEKISDVKTATIEPNGMLGYELMEDAKPLTIGQFKALAIELGMTNTNQINQVNLNKQANPANEDNVFTEVKNNRHQFEIPDQLH